VQGALPASAASAQEFAEPPQETQAQQAEGAQSLPEPELEASHEEVDLDAPADEGEAPGEELASFGGAAAGDESARGGYPGVENEPEQ